MISNASLSARRPGVSFLARSTPALGVIVLAAVSAVVHGVLTLWHTSPRFFPDEYIYSAISHSIGHGHLQVRGQPANFPSILQPLLAAPAWRFLSPRDAYHAIQFGNAVIATLVVLPLYLLGRRLELSRSVIWLTCLLGVVLPALAQVPVTAADFLGYPLAVGSIAAAVTSLAKPTAKRQAVFLVLALLATLAKVQYFVLVPSYIAGAVMLDRRRAPRRHWLGFLGLTPALVGVVLAATGYYSVSASDANWTTAKWVVIQSFLVVAPIAVAITPGALVAFFRPADRVQAAFGTIFVSFAVLMLLETSVSAGVEGRFKERYLFSFLPLLALGFGTYLKNGKPHARAVYAIAAILAVAAPLVPYARYGATATQWDSMTFYAVFWLERYMRGSFVSLIAVALALVGAVIAAGIARRPGRGTSALAITCVIAAATFAVAVHVDYELSYHSPNPAWVDRDVHGASVTAVQTPSSGKLQMIEQMYWNPRIDNEIVFPYGGTPTDAYATKIAVISPTGVLNAHRFFLFDHTGSQATFWNATPIGLRGWLTLYRATGKPRVRIFIENQLNSGWLSPIVRIRAWPKDLARKNMEVRFTLSLPSTSARTITMRVDRQRFVVRPGRSVALACSSATYPVTVLMSSTSYTSDHLGRPVSVRLSHARLTHASQASAPGCVRSAP